MKIEEAFIDQIKALMSQRLVKEEHTFTNKAHLLSAKEKQRQANIINRLKNPANEIQRVVDNLSQLPYVNFGIRYASHPTGGGKPILYLLGVTKPVYVRYDLRSPQNILETHHEALGKYIVAVPGRALIDLSLEGFHFIPMRNVNGENRHYHHRAHLNTHAKTPLDHQPETCWASVGTLMMNALSLGDIPSIFESGFIFLDRIDIHDTLTQPLAKRISIDTYKKVKGLNWIQYMTECTRDIDDIF